MISLMALPFEEQDLEPIISAQTIKIHYGKHHRAYVDKVNELIIGTKYQDMALEDIIRETYDKPEHRVLYNNAGQVYNHNVYWNSIHVWEHLDDAVKEEILLLFATKENLRMKLVDEAMQVFGSGWVWLVKNQQGNYQIITTHNGDTPIVLGYEALFNVDVWEHAYYLDYQNQRQQYLEKFIEGCLKI
ncbi:MAG: superoxide dismutase [Alphaproteobacteria bacterium]|nr:superoxide dismutase [Alphaproteobacteria bacterium]